MSTSTAWPTFDEVIADIEAVVKEATVIGCLAHKDADADSLGSALAFALAMRASGKTVHVLVPTPIPTLLRHLPGFEMIAPPPAHLDVLFTFDCATLARFGEFQSLVKSQSKVINVDHHVTSEGFGNVNLVDATASATGQVVYQLLQALNAPISPEVATNLYAALFTDTGGFRHDNTTEAALRLGADLVAQGANPGWVALKSYKSRSISQVRLEALAVSQLHDELDGALIWSSVTQEMMQQCGATHEETEGIIDYLQGIDTMRIAVMFKEVSQQLTKISVRTRDDIAAIDVCTPFGGGGHTRAAGAEIQLPIAEALEPVLQVARKLL